MSVVKPFLDRSSGFVVVFAALALMAGCSHRQRGPEAPLVGPPMAPGTSLPPVGPPEPTRPPQVPERKEADAGVKPLEKPHVALAFGGAGVASFATVGILKRLAEEGVVIDYIVATGWPALFALGYSYLNSIHDLEWFAMRLQEKDFYKAGLFDLGKEYNSHQALSETIERAFGTRDLGEARIPVIISAMNTDLVQPERYSTGDWKEALLKTMSVPGIFRPYPKNNVEWVSSLQGIDVEEAIRRGTKNIIAVEMYKDYFKNLGDFRKDSSDRVFRQLYLAQLRGSLRKEMKLAPIAGEIALNKPPKDFSAKRAAIQAGYKEATKILRQLRTMLN